MRLWRRRETEVLLKAIGELLQRVLREQIQDRPVIGSWTALLDYLQVALAHEPIEQFRVLFLDRKNILIRDEVQQRGTVDHTPLYPREITRRALELQASAMIMVHNHPSGDPTPSRADIEMTKQVVQALAPVGITVHDHVIVGKNRHTSFKSQRLIEDRAAEFWERADLAALWRSCSCTWGYAGSRRIWHVDGRAANRSGSTARSTSPRVGPHRPTRNARVRRFVLADRDGLQSAASAVERRPSCATVPHKALA